MGAGRFPGKFENETLNPAGENLSIRNQGREEKPGSTGNFHLKIFATLNNNCAFLGQILINDNNFPSIELSSHPI